MNNDVLKDFSMLGLFLMEAESQAQILGDGLLKLEKGAAEPSDLEGMMRAAHSLKGGARIMQAGEIVKFAHAMEDFFVAVIKGRIIVAGDHIDRLFDGVDLIRQIAGSKEDTFETTVEGLRNRFVELSTLYNDFAAGRTSAPSAPASTPAEPVPAPLPVATTDAPAVKKVSAVKEHFVKVTATQMDRLLGLAGESFVNVKKIQAQESELFKIKKNLLQFSELAEKINEKIGDEDVGEELRNLFGDFREQYNGLCRGTTDFVTDFSGFASRMESFSDDFYNEVVSCKIVPFEELARVFPRMVRDVAKELKKQVDFEVSGLKTGIDRDILDKLEASLSHLLRNAIDHGLETPEERLAAGKPAVGSLKMSAFHWAGMFNITISDDGRGIDLTTLRGHIIKKNLATAEMLENMPEKELLDFLFLPGFTTKSAVSEISGRGFGLDVVMSMIQEVKGGIHVETQCGKYTTFHLQLPITLSVISALIVEIGNELYAFPSTRIDRLLLIDTDGIKTMENHQFIEHEGSNIGVVSASEILGYPMKNLDSGRTPLLLLSDRYNQYALVVDRFIREEKIVVRPLDERLGKISGINSASVLDDGSPVLIADVDDIVRSIDNHVKSDTLHNLSRNETDAIHGKKKKVLVIDDSITVRELERQILETNGYLVETAVNGVDGWNAIRTEHYDIVITDIDMPRMNGFELVEKIKSSSKFKTLPVVIVSYKDREEDKLKGIECGADFYLTKSSFHDNTLVETVYRLIGEAVS